MSPLSPLPPRRPSANASSAPSGAAMTAGMRTVCVPASPERILAGLKKVRR